MIWLIGNRGMLGTELSLLLEERKISFVGTDREVDILSPDALSNYAKDKDIEWIINCAAYTAVDKAEDEEYLCRAINTDGPRNIAKLAQNIGAAVLHISTDYVFPGTADSPYREDAPTAPNGVYGKTKAEGEQALRDTLQRHVIIRTAWLYGKHGPNFVYTMLRLMKERDSLGVVADQIGSPTWAFDLATAILTVVTHPSPSWGTYHFTNGGQCSWHDFALEIQRVGLETSLLDKTIPVKALSTADYPTKAKRPAWSVLSKDKIARDYGVTIPGWKDSLCSFISQIATISRRQKKWLDLASSDLESVDLELGAGRNKYALFWCQQALEKTLKALVEFQDRPKPTHDIFKIASWLRLPLDDMQRDFFKRMSSIYIDTRYNVDSDALDSLLSDPVSRSLVCQTKETIQWLKTLNILLPR